MRSRSRLTALRPSTSPGKGRPCPHGTRWRWSASFVTGMWCKLCATTCHREPPDLIPVPETGASWSALSVFWEQWPAFCKGCDRRCGVGVRGDPGAVLPAAAARIGQVTCSAPEMLWLRPHQDRTTVWWTVTDQIIVTVCDDSACSTEMQPRNTAHTNKCTAPVDLDNQSLAGVGRSARRPPANTRLIPQ